MDSFSNTLIYFKILNLCSIRGDAVPGSTAGARDSLLVAVLYLQYEENAQTKI